jgi:hypothetical protein
METEQLNHIILDSFRQLGADREDAPQSLSLLFSYAREGGLRGLNDFIVRLETNSLTEQDKERIRDHYIARAKLLARRKALVGFAVGMTAPPFLASFLSCDYYQRLSQGAALPADRDRYEKMAQYCGVTSVVTGVPSTLATHAYFSLRERLSEISDGAECQVLLKNLSEALTPAIHQVAQKLAEISACR